MATVTTTGQDRTTGPARAPSVGKRPRRSAMSPRHQLVVLVAATLAAGLSVAGCAGSTDRAGNTPAGDPVVLRGVNPFNGPEVQAFAAEVRRLSHGTVTIRMTSPWHEGQPDSEAAAVRYVRQGHTDLAVASARAWHGLGVDSF